ncbi:MAG TPA: hydrogenase maturation protease [Rubrivivax sp.]|nr:hydrogenase maturation protease [Pseudomonadota bacterium]HPP83063.1 hydrogenase maturation protease [Rubrivivax sp.]
MFEDREDREDRDARDERDERDVLVLGLGNRLLGDDAAGPLVVDALARSARPPARLRDGGTIGLALLPEIEDARGLIAVDAAMFGAAPGTVRVFEGEAMDRQLGGTKRSAHEVALADLVAAAALGGRLPERRALVAVEPRSTALGLEPSAAVAAAIPRLCDAVDGLLARWTR